MAKFKRYDPRNKKAESKHFGNHQQFDKKRSRLMAQQQHNEHKRNRNNEKDLYSFYTEEFDL